MGKKNKMYRQFSQIRYADRLLIRKNAEIQAEREETAMRMIKSMLEALNDLEGYGFKRLIRYAVQFKRLIVEFYADRDYMEDQVYRRLKSHGVDCGNTFDRYNPGRTKAEHVAAEGLDAEKVALAIGLIAANDVAGYGADRLLKLIEKTQEIFLHRTESLANDIAHDYMLEQIGFCVENGAVMIYQNENGDAVQKRRAENAAG